MLLIYSPLWCGGACFSPGEPHDDCIMRALLIGILEPGLYGWDNNEFGRGFNLIMSVKALHMWHSC